MTVLLLFAVLGICFYMVYTNPVAVHPSPNHECSFNVGHIFTHVHVFIALWHVLLYIVLLAAACYLKKKKKFFNICV